MPEEELIFLKLFSVSRSLDRAGLLLILLIKNLLLLLHDNEHLCVCLYMDGWMDV